MLGRVRSGVERRAVHVALDRLGRLFQDGGAVPLDLPLLYPGEELLDLYGEDLRTRAFVYGDAERGEELCLRPDFTVPVALVHRDGGWDREAAYTYQGPVFRRQSETGRPVEYLQTGIERFGEGDIAATDAAVFETLRAGLRSMGVLEPVATIGDLSIVLSVLDALDMPDGRRAALKRHLWRPARFQDLIRRACAGNGFSEGRMQVLEADAEARTRMIRAAGEVVGAREARDVADRLQRLAGRRDEPRMPEADAALISNVLKVKGPVSTAVARLRELTESAGIDIGDALARMTARSLLLNEQGCPQESVSFDAAFGRTLEYYDGFVFEFRVAGGEVHPPLAGGGRYNAMTVRLGAAGAVPAIGGIIRPEAVLEVLA